MHFCKLSTRAIAALFDIHAVAVMHLFKLCIVFLHEHGEPPLQVLSLLLDLTTAKVPLREVLFLGVLGGCLSRCSLALLRFRAGGTLVRSSTLRGGVYRLRCVPDRSQLCLEAHVDRHGAPMLRLHVQVEPVFVEDLSSLGPGATLTNAVDYYFIGLWNTNHTNVRL